MKLIVYIDVYFLMNGIFDFCILILVGRIQKCGQKLWRLLAGAAVGGLGATLVLYFSVLLSSSGIVLQYGLLPVLMLLLSFGFSDKRSFLCQLLTFYAITFLFGGILIAFRQEGVQIQFILGTTTVVELFLWVLLPELQKRHRELQNEYKVAVNFGKSWIYGNALLDTGNRLREPISGKPVILAEFQNIKSGLPEGIARFFEENSLNSGENVLAKERLIEKLSSEVEGVEKLRWIPYRAVGTPNGFIPGIEAAQLRIWIGQRSITKERVWLGMVFEPLAPRGEYQFILQEDIVS